MNKQKETNIENHAEKKMRFNAAANEGNGPFEMPLVSLKVTFPVTYSITCYQVLTVNVCLFSLLSLICCIVLFDSIQVIHGTHLEPQHVMKRRSLDQQLRVKIYYDTSVYK